MKIIFLDMDGVLCTQRSHIAQGLQHMPDHHPFMDALDREGIGMLNKFNEKHPDVLYVLSSTWRKHHTLQQMIDYMCGVYGFNGEFHPDWKTVELSGPRGLEIQEWLARHPDTDNYLILDDNDDMLESQKYHFVQTDDFNGITMRNYWRMEQVFAEGNIVR
jgi:hypothetical protein